LFSKDGISVVITPKFKAAAIKKIVAKHKAIAEKEVVPDPF
jgi:hypothetical protein